MSPQRFRNLVWKHYKEQGRYTLPWRKTSDPYRILVSEVMLQQTQVDRVIPYYKAFLTRFPSVRALAAAPLKDVLALWQGLGYNRRAKMLHEAAKVVVRDHRGIIPKDAFILKTLPGVGPYTASAVAVFSSNADELLIETNIRTVITHHFFPTTKVVEDTEVLKVLQKVHPKGQARMWYAALMDYGSFLKRTGVRINNRAKGYTKQSAFKGSLREVRGAILRALLEGSATMPALLRAIGSERKDQLTKALDALIQEGVVTNAGARFSLAS